VTFQNFEIYKQDSNSTVYTKTNLEYLDLNPYNSKKLGTGRNVIALPKNFDKDKKILFLSAHYDTTDYTNGIIDNGTGTTVVLEIARILKNFNSDFNLGIVFLDAEEYFRYGSRFFVSILNDIEKNNILGCINIDMVGEKNAGPIVMQTPSNKNNLLSIAIEKSLGNDFSLSLGGLSDDLSFYMAKIPVVTFANKASNFELDAKSPSIQFENISIDILKNFSESISKFLLESKYSNLSKNYINSDLNKFTNKFKLLENFKLINIKEVLIENGFDTKLEYTYKNTETNIEFLLTEESLKFINPDIYKDFTISNTDNTWSYQTNNNSQNKLSFTTNDYFCTISGNISSEESFIILENYYKNYFETLFEHSPTGKIKN
ncbi:MAG: M28 family metallopeptidase, partial [Sarcina sp.]